MVLCCLAAAQLPELCQGQLALSVESATGQKLDSTGVQIPGLLDDLFYTDEPLGSFFCHDTKQHRVSVWVRQAISQWGVGMCLVVRACVVAAQRGGKVPPKRAWR